MARAFVFLVMFLTAYTHQTSAGLAHEIKAGDIVISHPWARASLSVKVRNGVSYMTIHNSGAQVDRLISVTTHVSERAELHTTQMKGDVMKMQSVDSVEIPAGGTVALNPGGLHIMLMGLRTPLMKGQTFPMTLKFETAGEVDVDVVIEAGTSRGKSMDHDGHMKK